VFTSRRWFKLLEMSRCSKEVQRPAQMPTNRSSLWHRRSWITLELLANCILMVPGKSWEWQLLWAGILCLKESNLRLLRLRSDTSKRLSFRNAKRFISSWTMFMTKKFLFSWSSNLTSHHNLKLMQLSTKWREIIFPSFMNVFKERMVYASKIELWWVSRKSSLRE
jgi:hypothetical protein